MKNEKGFVVGFNENGEGVKVKFARYLEPLKALRRRQDISLSEKVLPSLLKDPMKWVAALLDSIPDEYFDEVQATIGDADRVFEGAGKISMISWPIMRLSHSGKFPTQ